MSESDSAPHRRTAAVILAAGRGARMRSRRNKMVHPLAGRPMACYPVQTAQGIGCAPVVLVCNEETSTLRAHCDAQVIFVPQGDTPGTGGAVAAVEPVLRGRAETVLVIYGDTPLLSPETMSHMVAHQHDSGKPLILLTARMSNPAGRGRIIRDGNGAVVRIVEEREASTAEKQIDEFNTGIMCFAGAWLWEHLPRLPVHEHGELYLTDLVAFAVAEGEGAETVLHQGAVVEVLGINDRAELALAEQAMRERIRLRVMQAGVTLIDPATTWIDDTVVLGEDVTVYPNCHLYGQTVVAEECVIGPNTRLQDTRLGKGVTVTESVLEGAVVADGVRIGPFAHLRPGTVVESEVEIGNYAELKNTRVGRGTKIHHVSYLGDATLGENVNVGAGTITCNYDGQRKHPTVIEDGAFLGSDTLLIAPVRVGRGALTGAGSVVTRDLPAGVKAYGVPARVHGVREEKARAGEASGDA